MLNLVLFLAGLLLMTGTTVFAQPGLCEDIGSESNSEYPEIDSKCVGVTKGPTQTNIFAQYRGPQFGTKSSDPVCSSIATDVRCRRICGDLPAGKEPDDAHIVKSINPPNFARYDLFESFHVGDHYRVCYRTKNWANDGINNGQARTFAFSVPYKQASGAAAPQPQKAKSTSKTKPQAKAKPADASPVEEKKHSQN